MMNIPLAGISFNDLPYIPGEWRDPDMSELMHSGALLKRKGLEAVVIRENGEPWDSDAFPAYSVRLDGLHIGYIPLQTTLNEQMLKAKDGYKKVWKGKYENMSKEQLREESAAIIARGETAKFCDWAFVGKDEMWTDYKKLTERCDALEAIRNQLNTDFNFNHIQPMCRVCAGYYDEKERFNWNEVGEICTVIAVFDDIGE